MMALAGTDFNQGRGTRDDGTNLKSEIPHPKSKIRQQF